TEFAVTHTKKITQKIDETYGYMLMQNMKFSIGVFAGRKNNFYIKCKRFSRNSLLKRRKS
ncbi:MAG: hypothetical protein RR614_08440, partial [Eubacterium sp.]